MRYILHCLFRDAIVRYQAAVIAEIAERFNLHWTKRQALAPHFTVKYWFESDRIEDVESVLDRFTQTHVPTDVRVGGIGGFPPDVVFLNVELSIEARQTFNALVAELRQISWMQWHEHDGEGLYFHATIAERCGNQYESILKSARQQERFLTTSFDNITILRRTVVEGGIDKWVIHRTYELIGGR